MELNNTGGTRSRIENNKLYHVSLGDVQGPNAAKSLVNGTAWTADTTYQLVAGSTAPLGVSLIDSFDKEFTGDTLLEATLGGTLVRTFRSFSLFPAS